MVLSRKDEAAIAIVIVITITIIIIIMVLSRKEAAADNDAATIGSYYAQTQPIITPPSPSAPEVSYRFNLTATYSDSTKSR